MYYLPILRTDVLCAVQTTTQEEILRCARRASARILIQSVVSKLDLLDEAQTRELTKYLQDVSVSTALDHRRLCVRGTYLLRSFTLNQLEQFSSVVTIAILKAENRTDQRITHEIGVTRTNFELQFEAAANDAVAEILNELLTKRPSKSQLISA